MGKILHGKTKEISVVLFSRHVFFFFCFLMNTILFFSVIVNLHKIITDTTQRVAFSGNVCIWCSACLSLWWGTDEAPSLLGGSGCESKTCKRMLNGGDAIGCGGGVVKNKTLMYCSLCSSKCPRHINSQQDNVPHGAVCSEHAASTLPRGEHSQAQ